MRQSKEPYFIESNNVLLSIAAAFFLTNSIELLVIISVSVLLSQSMNIDIIQYCFQSLLLISGLWAAFKIFKQAPIYLIALSVSILYTIVMTAWFFANAVPFIEKLALINFISSYILIFIWMHLTQNLDNKSKALKTGYFSYFLCIELMTILQGHTYLHIALLILAIVGYKISSTIFELMVKIGFKIFNVKTV